MRGGRKRGEEGTRAGFGLETEQLFEDDHLILRRRKEEKMASWLQMQMQMIQRIHRYVFRVYSADTEFIIQPK